MLWNSGTWINILHLRTAGKRKKRIFRVYSSNSSEKYLCERLCELSVNPLDLTVCCHTLGDSVALKFSSVQSLSRVWLFATPWTAARQASLSIISSQSLLKFMSIELVMPSNHLIFCHPLLLPSSIFPRIRAFSMSQFFVSGGQSIGASASASVLPMNIQDWFPLGWTGLPSRVLSKKKCLSLSFWVTHYWHSIGWRINW